MTDSNTAAVAIQSAWRGKRTRQTIRRQDVAASNIQRLFRGVLSRRRFATALEAERSVRYQRQQQQQRLRSIKSKEGELLVLRTTPASALFSAEKVRKTHAARIIQRQWKRKKSSGDIEFLASPSEESKQADQHAAEKALIKNYIFSNHLTNAFFSTSAVDDSDHPDAVGLSDLYERIKLQCDQKAQVAAAKRSNGVRHKYKNLLEMQQKASILLDEYYEQQHTWQGIQHERKLRLKYIKENISFMSEYPPIEQAESFINSLSVEQMGSPKVIDDALFSSLLDQSIDSHLSAMNGLSSDRWDCVFIPLEGEMSVKGSSLRHNVLSTSEGDAAESLVWTTFAMQPCALLKSDIPKISNRTKALQRELLVETRDPTAHSQSLLKAIEREATQVESLASALRSALWKDIRRKFDKNAQRILKQRTKEDKIRACIRLQSMMRAFLARKRAAVLRDQQRVIRAVKTFVKEIAGMKCVDQVDALELSKAFLPSIHQGMQRISPARSTPKPAHSVMLPDTNARQQPSRSSIPVFSPHARSTSVSQSPAVVSTSQATGSRGDSLPTSLLRAEATSGAPAALISGSSKTGIPFDASTPVRRTQSPRSAKSVRVVAAESPLSPFLGMSGFSSSNNMSNGYISPVSDSHTMSHSLSMSFGRITDNSLGHINELTASGGVSNDKYPLFDAAISRYQHNKSPLSSVVEEALSSRINSFDEKMVGEWMSSFKSFCKPSMFFQWLHSRTESDEIDLEFAAMIISDVWYHYLPATPSREECANCAEFCKFLRSLAAKQRSGQLPLLLLQKKFLEIS